MTKKNLKETVYDSIMESIYSSEYHSNEIITESSLIKKFGFSKSPIREALLALCQDGVLKNIPRCGYQIISLDTENIRQIQEYRFILESGMIEKGINHMTDEDFEKLEQLDELCNMETSDVLEHWMHNLNFHIALITPAGNPYACEQLRDAMMLLFRAYAQIHWNKQIDYSFLNDMKYHKKIISALKSGNKQEAIEYLRCDFDDFGTSEH